LFFAVKEALKRKFPEKTLISPEKAFSEVLPENPHLLSWFSFPERYESEILDFAAEPQLEFLATNDKKVFFEEDLRSFSCPEASIRARILLSALPANSEVCLLVSGGNPIENVPAALIADGCLIQKREKKGNFWKIFVLKQNEVK
ncbi:MAG: hypothetical protein UIH18_00110, partial [Fibrobacteraceae bacterium]|nr:hypothetical protein [Fibrobacteraceae bacterium]